MFKPHKPSGPSQPSRHKLPLVERPPKQEDISTLFTGALRIRGTIFVLPIRPAPMSPLYIITCMFDHGCNETVWGMYEDSEAGNQLFNLPQSDLDMVFDMVCMSCNTKGAQMPAELAPSGGFPELAPYPQQQSAPFPGQNQQSGMGQGQQQGQGYPQAPGQFQQHQQQPGHQQFQQPTAPGQGQYQQQQQYPQGPGQGQYQQGPGQFQQAPNQGYPPYPQQQQQAPAQPYPQQQQQQPYGPPGGQQYPPQQQPQQQQYGGQQQYPPAQAPYQQGYPGGGFPHPEPAPAPAQAPMHGADTTKPEFSNFIDLLNKGSPNLLLGHLFVESGIMPEQCLDAALKLQELVRKGRLNNQQAVLAMKRAAELGGYLDDDIIEWARDPHLYSGPRPGRPTGTMPKAAPAKPAGPAPGQPAGAPPPRDNVAAQRIADLLKQAGLVTDEDLETAKKVKSKHGGELSQILVSAGKLNGKTVEAAAEVQNLVAVGRLRIDKAIMALHYCERMRVGLKEALSELQIEIS